MPRRDRRVRSEITTANLLADLVYDLWSAGRIRPWLAAGAGVRHYDISWEDILVSLGWRVLRF